MDTQTSKVRFPSSLFRAFLLFTMVSVPLLGSSIVHAQVCGEDHVVVEGESLSKIAQTVYGDAQKWSVIYTVNLDVIGDNPNLILIGQRLRIPCLEQNNEPKFVEQVEETPSNDDDTISEDNAVETASATTNTDTENTTEVATAENSSTESSTTISTTTEDTTADVSTTDSNSLDSSTTASTSTEDATPDASGTESSSSDSSTDATSTTTEAAVADTSTAQSSSTTVDTTTENAVVTDTSSNESSATENTDGDTDAEMTVDDTDTANTVADNGDAIKFLTADDYSPFTDRKLINGGMVTDMLVTALENHPDKPAFNISWINDWSQHLDPLLTNFEYDLGFPWLQPDCVSTPDDYRCQNFNFSNPVIHVLVLLYTDKNRPLVFNKDSDIEGAVLCRPNGYYTHDLEKDGRLWLTNNVITLEQPDSIKDCFDMLTAGEVDAVALNEYTGRSAVSELSLSDRVEVLENKPLSIEGLHVVVHKNHPRAQELINTVNDSMSRLQLSTEYNSIVDLHFSRFWSTID